MHKKAPTSLRARAVCLASALAITLALVSPLRAAEETVTLNFVNADIQAVIKAVAEITGRNMLIDPRVTGTVNIVAPKPVPKSMVFSILLSALRAQGFTAVGGDAGFIRILPEAEAKFYSGAGDPRNARGDQVVTEVFQLQYESAPQLVPILRPLVSPNNVINAFPASNTLIITDYAENLRRIRRVIASVDQPNAGELITLKLDHAAAVDVAQTIQRLIPEAAAPAQPGVTPKIAITVDARTNSLLIRADNTNIASRIRTLASSLDTPVATSGNIHVVYLRNAEAVKVAETLRAILSGQSSARSTTSPQPFGAPTAPGGLGGAQGTLPGQPSSGLTPQQQFGSSFGAPFGAPGAQTGTSAGGSAGGATVQAYPETNSLVIVAPDYLYNVLRSVIDKLDARRAQVFVEALIVEVTSSKAAEFGIQWQDLSGLNRTGTQVVGGTNFNVTPGSNIISAASSLTSLGPGLNLGLIRGRVSLGGVEFLNLGALIRALESDNSANILSTPTLLTLDNEEAKIIVGQNIPIVTGSFALPTAGGAATANPFQTVARQDVGLTLRVRPQVAEGGAVKLQLYQEVSSVFDRTNPAGIITNKRALESTVVVDDGQVIVLGGLISDDVQGAEQRVPLLGSIPYIGGLFRYENRRREKTNLMVFLRPVVLRDGEQATNLTGDRYEYIRGIQQGQQLPSRVVLPDMKPPVMPPLDRSQPQPVPPQRPAAPTPPPPEIDLRQPRPSSDAAPPAPVVVAPVPAPAPIAAPTPEPMPSPPATADPAPASISAPEAVTPAPALQATPPPAVEERPAERPRGVFEPRVPRGFN